MQDADGWMIENSQLRIEATSSLGAGIKSLRFLDPEWGEIPILMEQPVQDFANTAWQMLPAGRCYDFRTGQFGLVRHEGREFWIGNPQNGKDQLNGIHGPFAGAEWRLARNETDEQMPLMRFAFDGRQSPGFAEKWPWPNLEATVTFQLCGKSLFCREAFLYHGPGTMPFLRGWHPFFPHWLNQVGDPVSGVKLPAMQVQASHYYPIRNLNGDDILVPEGSPLAMTAKQSLDNGVTLPLGLDHCYKRSPMSFGIGMTYAGSKGSLTVRIRPCDEYGWATVYSPPALPTPSRFGEHFALEWQTGASNAFALHDAGVPDIGFDFLQPGVPKILNWALSIEVTKAPR